MRAVIQRVSKATVSIDGILKDEINSGLLLLLAISTDDTAEDVSWLSSKINGLRLFPDASGKINLDCREANADYLVVSQFTLLASTKKGNRPSFIRSAPPSMAKNMYEEFIQSLSLISDKKIHSGEFGAMMEISLTNTGPFTIIIDTKNKE